MLYLCIRQNLDIGMPADLDQFGRENSGRTLISRKGLVELCHVSTNGRGLLDKIDLKSGRREIEGGLNTANPAANDQDISEMALYGNLQKLFFNIFFFHYTRSSSGFICFRDGFPDDLCDILNS